MGLCLHEGVSSARVVERRCAYHPSYQWLMGCEVINHPTLSDFRIQHQVALDALFSQLLGVLSSEGLISSQRVMNDGTKIKASASVRIPMMVMGDSDLIVMVVSERNDHHDRSEATLTLRWCLN